MARSEKTLLRLLAKAAQLMPVIPRGNNLLLLHRRLWLQMPYSSSKGAPQEGQTAQSHRVSRMYHLAMKGLLLAGASQHVCTSQLGSRRAE